MNDKIYLKNMVFYGFHGVYEFERELGQRFFVDLEMSTDFINSSKTDELKDTIDYVSVYHKVRVLVENTRFQLLETLVSKIAEEVLSACEAITEVKVKVRKASLPIAGSIDYVEVETTMAR